MTSQENQVIASVDLVRLMQKFLPEWKLTGREVTGFGVVHRFVAGGSASPLSVAIGVHADVSLAHDAFERQSLLLSVGPTEMDRLVGDEVRVWKLGDAMSGSILFRRLNAVVYLSGGLPFDERFGVAEQLDKAFQMKHPDVVHADTIVPPEVVKVDFPGTVRVGEDVTAKIEVAGVAPSDALFGTENTNVVIVPGEKPSLTFYAPDKAGEEKIVLIISTKGNLLSRTTLTVQVTK